MKLARIIGYGILAISVAYFAVAAWKYIGSLPPISWNAATIVAICAVVALYLAQFVTSGVAWHLWLRAVHEPSSPALAIALFSFSQFGKYVPGSVAHHIARVALGQRHGLGAVGMIVSLAMENAWAILAGVAVAVIALIFMAPPMAGVELPSPLRILLVMAIALLLPLVGIWLVGPHRPTFMNRLLGAYRVAYPGLGTIVACFLLYAANLTLSGYNLDLLARLVFDAPAGHALHAIGIFAIAWIMSVLALVSPGGIGVREAVLLAGLAPAYGAGTALGVAVAYRLVTLLGDGVGFVLGFLGERYIRRSDPA